ncbi:Hsp33 family molecular chaperone HslO [Thermodesulfovibrio thiophilus]|uniref:Hsp33 family molecular chaperone HslO n=1 Tax=Thermodesulfovibrio thiophilus TaxID=340095 RepID=UPI0017E816FD|nr:Hsp33 family molecular chaperone HslO [Thermodesulfovibrio thiophilus]HHW20280.1 Hsp33 family molecular chaperone HslO [Thermodesulfovibrio thiophilus]
MDEVIKALIKDEHVLAVATICTQTVDYARRIHDTWPTATAALGRVMAGSILLASTLKDNQKIMMQVKGDGPLKEIFAEADWKYRVRGYVKRPHIYMGLKGEKIDVGRAVGKGFLNIIRDLGLREYYQSSVSLQTGEIATDLAYYLNVSEQIPSAVSLGVFVDPDNSVKAAGGFMIQTMPETNIEIIEFLERKLSHVKAVSSMILQGMNPFQILEEAVGLPVEVLDRKEVTYFCPCTKERVLNAIVTLGRDEIQKMIEEEEIIKVECYFCNKKYEVTVGELKNLNSLL